MRTFVIWAVLALALSVLMINTVSQPSNIRVITFSEFIRQVEQDNIREVTFKTEGRIVGEFLNSESSLRLFSTTGDTSNPEIFKILKSHNVVPNYDYSPQSGAIAQLLFGFIPIIGLLLLMLYFLNRASKDGGTNTNSRIASFGANQSKLIKFEGKVKFDHVAGHEEVKEDLKEIIDYLKDSSKYVKMGARIPKGVLLEGPPGTGKTLLAKATAGEAGVPFFSTSGSDFVEMFVGVGASRVRGMFAEGKKNAPCIIFIDEIDAIGKKRGGSEYSGSHNEQEQTLNQILVEMDGFNTSSGVIIMAATNRADVLDPALVRPGRFDRKVTLSNPDIKAREAILQVHCKEKPIDSGVNLNSIARGTPGFSGADLENLVNEAVLLAVRQSKSIVSNAEFEEARDKIMMGPERKTLAFSEENRKATAYHEAGHALLGKLLPGLDPIHKVTIIPRGPALGLTQTLPTDDKVSLSQDQAEKTISFLMGGRIAEEIVLQQITSGASNDISRATEIARHMVMKFGMSELGPMEFKPEHNSKDEINFHVGKIINRNYVIGKELLLSNIQALHSIAEELLNKETLTGDEIDLLLKK